MNRRGFLKFSFNAWTAGVTLGAGAASGTLQRLEREYEDLVSSIPHAQPQHIAGAHAIAIFNGPKQERAVEGIKLCEADQKLFVTGYDYFISWNEAQTFYQLANSPHLHIDRTVHKVRPENVTIDNTALRTSENADDLARWLQANSAITNIIVVTSDFHVPRAWLEVRRALAALDHPVTVHMYGTTKDPRHEGAAYRERNRALLQLALYEIKAKDSILPLRGSGFTLLSRYL